MKKLSCTAMTVGILLVSAPVRGKDKELSARRDVPRSEVTQGVVLGGEITDGTNLWRVQPGFGPEGIVTDFEVPIGTDHEFARWFWYRVAGDTAETIMPPPDSESYSGDTATLTWSDVDGRGLFDAQMFFFVSVSGSGGFLGTALTVTNISGSNLDLTVFPYADMDVDGSAGGDSAIRFSPDTVIASETSEAWLSASPGIGYRVEAWPAVRDALNDNALDDFTGTGTPFGPGDFTAGFQQRRVLAPGQTYFYSLSTCVNSVCFGATIFLDGFETGDTSNWSSTIP